MNSSVEEIRDELEFVRTLVEDDAQPLSRDWAVMVAVGTVFGLMGVRAWLMGSGRWEPPAIWRPWMLLDAPLFFAALLPIILKRFPAGPKGTLGRALSAAWSAVGVGVTAMSLAFGAAAWKAANVDVMGLFTPMLFILYGMAWWMAYRIRLRASLMWVALGSFATAGLTGALVGMPELWLAEAAGLFLWVLVPGVVGLRASRRQTA